MSPDFGFPKILQSKCIAYNPNTNISSVLLSAYYTGEVSFVIGTADTPTGTITWESSAITEDTQTSLSNSNKALFYRAVGNTGSVLTKIRIKYN